MKVIRTLSQISALVAALLLAACGGGAGGSPEPTSSRASVTISAANQDAVAAAALNAAFGASSATLSVPLDSGGRAFAAATDTAATGTANAQPRSIRTLLLDFALDAALAPLLERSAVKTALAARPLATVTASQPCRRGGSVTVTLNDIDNNQAPSAGDSASIAFSQCRPILGELVNGSISLTYSALTITPVRTDIAATLTFGDLSALSADGTYSIGGSVSLSASKQGAVTTAQLVVGAGGLTVSATTPTYADTVSLAGGLTIAATVDDAAVPPSGGAAGSRTVRVDGSVSSTRLAGGTIVINTVTPVKKYDIDAYPREGQIVITGAANSKLRLTAISTTTLRIELDANGDGTYETSVDRAWGDVI